MSNSHLVTISNFLKKVSFFSEVSESSLEKLCSNSEFQLSFKNSSIIKKGEVGDSMFVIIAGKVKVHDEDYVYDFLETGDCFGEYALIDNETRSASITAVEETKVLKIHRTEFLLLMEEDKGFSQGIMSVLIKRHRELDTIQESLASSKLKIELTNAKMSGLINGAMDAIIMFNGDFRILITNPSALKLLENNDVEQRNILFFFDDESATIIESIIKENSDKEVVNMFIPSIVKVIGSNETVTNNEGTISKYGTKGEYFYTLILRNIEERLQSQNAISLLTSQTEYLEKEIKELTSSYGIIAKDEQMLNVLKQIEKVAATDTTILINGETGTGKELVARAIHKASNRSDKAMIRINCGAMPANLIESELFGHEKGAYTGASASRKGRFLLADKGTIFLDEIGELPIELQPKLLRIIQEGEFEPLGSSETIKIDVRIISATHRDLFEFSKEGKFREDLYYRLNVFPIVVPELRKRGNDIILIAEKMITQLTAKMGKRNIILSVSDKNLLASYDWPGNVRELQNLIERAVIVSENGVLNWQSIIPSTESISVNTQHIEDRVLSHQDIIKFEKENILKALKKTEWKISGKNGAASLLNIPSTTLASKIKTLDIKRPI